MNRLFRRFLLVSFITTALPFFFAGKLSAQDAMTPMFTNSDLSGWVRTNTPAETWKFENDVLYCTGKPIGELRTEKMYQNFVMEVEWRHMVPRGNAGIFVWADDITARGVPFHRGIEVQVLENEYGNTKSHTTHGDIFPIHGAKMTPINGRGGSRAFPIESRSNPSTQWNHYRIECQDGEISLAVNGKVVTRGKECMPRKGYICLESEGGVVEYRNVRIQELPGPDLPPEQVAIANRGYRSLYSGLNLDGWHATDTANWKVKDWVLAYEGKQPGSLKTTEEFSESGFVIDVRLKNSASAAVIQAGSIEIDLQAASIKSHLVKTGSWNRVELIQQDGKQTLEINGNQIDVPMPPGQSKGKLILQPTGPVDFCNLYAS
ncbi:MAG: family 16 glycoside hydrolase [Rubripirellula sp.]